MCCLYLLHFLVSLLKENWMLVTQSCWFFPSHCKSKIYLISKTIKISKHFSCFSAIIFPIFLVITCQSPTPNLQTTNILRFQVTCLLYILLEIYIQTYIYIYIYNQINLFTILMVSLYTIKNFVLGLKEVLLFRFLLKKKSFILTHVSHSLITFPSFPPTPKWNISMNLGSSFSRVFYTFTI